MKTSIFKISLLFTILVACSLQTKANHVKSLHRSWPQNKVQSLSIENKFGNINFIDTRKDSVTIDVSVTFFDVPEKKAQTLSSLIHFEFEIEDGRVKAKTIFDNDFKSNNKFEINYTINIPENRYLDIKNKFGNVTLQDLKSGGEFDIAYGNINGNKITSKSSEKVKIDLKYGNGSFESIDRVNAKISYSGITINELSEGQLNTKYSTIKAEKCGNLTSESEYDTYSLGTIENIEINSKFTSWNIGELKSKFNFINQYGDLKIRNVSKNFKEINIDNQFGDIKVNIDPTATYNLKADSKFCNINYPKTSPTKLIKDDFHCSVEATIGTGSVKSTVEVQSKYGKVDLME